MKTWDDFVKQMTDINEDVGPPVPNNKFRQGMRNILGGSSSGIKRNNENVELFKLARRILFRPIRLLMTKGFDNNQASMGILTQVIGKILSNQMGATNINKFGSTQPQAQQPNQEI